MLVTMGLTGNTDTQIAFYILIVATKSLQQFPEMTHFLQGTVDNFVLFVEYLDVLYYYAEKFLLQISYQQAQGL